MPETIADDVIEPHLCHQFGAYRVGEWYQFVCRALLKSAHQSQGIPRWNDAAPVSDNGTRLRMSS